jgi:membrane-bound metal-dependent hydrolase YbcI (DUF457 family)
VFIGHYALAFAAKRVAPRASLGTLVAAAQFLDLLWPILLIVHVEQVAPGTGYFTALRFTHYPWSHSLAMALIWAVLGASVYGAARHDRTGAIVVGVLVVSHWLLDLVVHEPDLPLYPGGSARLGLALWDFPVATVVVEGIMFVAGVGLYVAGTRPRDSTGRYVWWSFVAFLVLIYLASLGGPPPRNLAAVGWVSLLLWITPVWAWWADAHRTPVRGDA